MATRPTFEHFNQAWADKIIGRRSPKGIDGYLGITVESFEPGRLVAGFDVTDELVTMIGNIHGGCIAALIDHCLGVVMYPIMPEGYWAATTEWKVNYLRPVTAGRVRAEADVVSMSKSLAVVSIEVTNEDRLVALAQGTNTIVPPKTG